VPRGQQRSEVHLVGLKETRSGSVRPLRAALQNSNFDSRPSKITGGSESGGPFDAQQEGQFDFDPKAALY
jgi:hypothetical protein